MAKNKPVRKLPSTPPPAKGPRAPLAAEIAAMRVGGDPVCAPLAQRNRIAQLVRYWGGRLGHTYTTRKMQGVLVIWRTA